MRAKNIILCISRVSKNYSQITYVFHYISILFYSKLYFLKCFQKGYFWFYLVNFFSTSNLIDPLFKSSKITSFAIVKEFDILLLLLLSKQVGKVQRKVIFYCESLNSVKYTMNVQTPKLKITNSSYMSNTKCAENEHKL